MKSIRLWCLGAVLLVLNISSYAQDYEQGSGIAGCQAGSGVCNGPQQLQQQQSVQQQAPQAPPEKWESRWGAIATDEPHGVLGSSAGISTGEGAGRVAINDCRIKGGIDCTLQVSYANGCGALVVGDKVFNANWGATVDEAVQKGLSMCKKASPNCHVYYTTCSPAVRVQ